MPTVFAHALVPVAVGLGLGRARIPPRLLLAGAVAAMLPDADVIAFKFGIAYADALGHRGATHSLVFALVQGVLSALSRRSLRTTAMTAFLFVGLSALSHPLLDMLTNGGLGVALLWPWSEQRLFAPWQVIEVSPFTHRFFSARDLDVLWSEARWIGTPALLAMAVLVASRFLWERRQSR